MAKSPNQALEEAHNELQLARADHRREQNLRLQLEGQVKRLKEALRLRRLFHDYTCTNKPCTCSTGPINVDIDTLLEESHTP